MQKRKAKKWKGKIIKEKKIYGQKNKKPSYSRAQFRVSGPENQDQLSDQSSQHQKKKKINKKNYLFQQSQTLVKRYPGYLENLLYKQ